jgi:hypothetical protein
VTWLGVAAVVVFAVCTVAIVVGALLGVSWTDDE